MTIFMFLAFLFGKIFSSSEEILNKYSSIITKNNSMIMNITEFKYDENIYLTLKSLQRCVEFIEYQFYDDIEKLYFPDPEFKYTVRPNIKIKKYIFGPNQNIYYYTIVKRKDILDNLKGNILYLKFNCGGEVEIINTRKEYENLYLKVIIFTSIIMLSIFILIIVIEIIHYFIKVMKNSLPEHILNLNKNLKYSNKNIIINPIEINRKYPQERVVYVEVKQPNLYNITQDNNNNINYYPNNTNCVPNYKIYNQYGEQIMNNNPYIIPMNDQYYPQAPIIENSLSNNTPNSPEQTFIVTGIWKK